MRYEVRERETEKTIKSFETIEDAIKFIEADDDELDRLFFYEIYDTEIDDIAIF